MTIISTIVRNRIRSRWWSAWTVDRPETKVGKNPSQFILKHKIFIIFIKIFIFPQRNFTRGRSYFMIFGRIFLILIFSFDKTQPIVNSLYDIGWINFINITFLQSLQDWSEKSIRSMSKRMISPSLLNISPPKKEKFAHVDSHCKSGE